MTTSVHGRMGDLSYVPHCDDANTAGCVVDYVVNLDPVAFGAALSRPYPWLNLRPVGAELLHETLKLDPIRDVQCRPLFDGIAIKGNRVSGWTRGDALQNRIFAFLRDLRRLDFRGLFQNFGRNRDNSSGRTLLQTLESFPQFIGTCS
jgi:hypothetical protein